MFTFPDAGSGLVEISTGSNHRKSKHSSTSDSNIQVVKSVLRENLSPQHDEISNFALQRVTTLVLH